MTDIDKQVGELMEKYRNDLTHGKYDPLGMGKAIRAAMQSAQAPAGEVVGYARVGTNGAVALDDCTLPPGKHALYTAQPDQSARTAELERELAVAKRHIFAMADARELELGAAKGDAEQLDEASRQLAEANKMLRLVVESGTLCDWSEESEERIASEVRAWCDQYHAMKSQLAEATSYALPDDMYSGSKDWTAGGYSQRVEWLHSMYESSKQERNEIYRQLEEAQQTLKDHGEIQAELCKQLDEARRQLAEAQAKIESARSILQLGSLQCANGALNVLLSADTSTLSAAIEQAKAEARAEMKDRLVENIEMLAAGYRSLADSPIVTERGKLLHEGMWGGAQNCIVLIREFHDTPQTDQNRIVDRDLLGNPITAADVASWAQQAEQAGKDGE